MILKEYVYLDMDLVNSYLAQIDEGMLKKIISGQSNTDSHQENGGDEQMTSVGASGSLLNIVSGNGDYSKKELDTYSSVYSENNSELIETALADYSLDVLTKKLLEMEKLKQADDDWKDGDLVFSTDSFSVFNFEQLQQSVKKENLQNVLTPDLEIDKASVELEKLNKDKYSRVKHAERIAYLEKYLKENDPYHNFGNILRFANYSSVLFPNTILFKIGKSLSFCSKENIRINTPLLTFLSQTDRKVNILGIVLTKRTKKLQPKVGVQLQSSVIAANAPAIFNDIILESFGLIEIDDYFIRPIAIYFDQE